MLPISAAVQLTEIVKACHTRNSGGYFFTNLNSMIYWRAMPQCHTSTPVLNAVCYTGAMISSDIVKMLKRVADRIRLHADWEEPPRVAYSDPSRAPEPYPSVYCMPHVRQLLTDVFSVVPLALCFSNTKESLPQLASQSLKCIENMDAVDRFYEIFQDEQWVFHESLPIDKVQSILAEAERGKISVREAGHKMADIYDERFISFNITRMFSINFSTKRNTDGPFSARGELLNEAKKLYMEGRYSGCIHLLLSCVDGAANDFHEHGENKQGLWSRKHGTVSAYDTYAGHKHGLVSVLKTATKKITELPEIAPQEFRNSAFAGEDIGNVYKGMLPERYLYRHGIEHGMLVNYGNKLVAAKAWNLIFAVGDWMNSVHKAREPVDLPKCFAESINDIMSAVASNQKYKELSASHVKLELKPDHTDFSKHPLSKKTKHFLECWKGNKSGVLCREMWQFGTERTLPFWWDRGEDKHIKDHFEYHRIRSFRIDQINHYSYEFADVRITCRFDGYVRSEKINRDISMTLKWILTDENDNLPFESETPDWYLLTWCPWLNAEVPVNDTKCGD